ncbi:MAG: hypothetical protein K8T25_24910 [Planctomycetia bacterium]|nr:hypothetical protein [Planctomycetia bacterium]
MNLISHPSYHQPSGLRALAPWRTRRRLMVMVAGAICAAMQMFLTVHQAAAQSPPTQPSLQGDPIPTRQSLFAIPFTVNPTRSAADGPTEVQLYVTDDSGLNWKLASREEPKAGRFVFRAPHDGEYWFRVQTVWRGNQFSPQGSPQPGLKVIVDSVAPSLDLTANEDRNGEIVAQWRAGDPYLDSASLKLEYQATLGGPWQPVNARYENVQNTSQASSGIARFRAPTGVDSAAIRAEILDRAGNHTLRQALVQLTRRQENALASSPTGPAPLPPVTADRRTDGSTPWPTDKMAQRPLTGSNDIAGPALGEPPPLGGPMLPNPPLANDASATPVARQDINTLPPRGNATPAMPAALGRDPAPGPAAMPPAGTGPAPLPGANAPLTGGAPPLISPSVNNPSVNPAGNAPAAGAMPTTSLPGGSSPGGPLGRGSAPQVYDVAPRDLGTIPPRAPDNRDTQPRDTQSHPGAATPPPGTLFDTRVLPPGVTPQQIRSLKFQMDYGVESVGTAGVGRVELWGTRDGGRTWSSFGLDNDNQSPMVVSVPGNGLYGFRIVVTDTAGHGEPAPRGGEAPQSWIAVDASPPDVRLTTVDPRGDEVQIYWQVFDEQLDPRGIALYYSRRADGDWIPIAQQLANDGQYQWRPDARLSGPVFLRLEAKDLAGNVGSAVTREPLLLNRPLPKATINAVRPQ